MRRFSVVALLAAGLVVFAQMGQAQTEAETKIEIPQLDAFHEVIFPMWHRAYPEKDTAMLRSLWPDVQRHVAAVKKAELPGILRDKREAWEKGVERLSIAEKAYGEALASGGIEAKLKAAEDLHSSYEGLVRTIWPVVPELASFHEVLYRIYHYYLPNKDEAKLKESLPLLSTRMEVLNKAVLPKRLAVFAGGIWKGLRSPRGEGETSDGCDSPRGLEEDRDGHRGDAHSVQGCRARV